MNLREIPNVHLKRGKREEEIETHRKKIEGKLKWKIICHLWIRVTLY
jgi:hypothetical protein